MDDEDFQQPYAVARSRSTNILTGPVDPVAAIEPISVPFGRVTLILRRHAWVILGIFLLGVGGASLAVHGMSKRYTAQASIIIEPQQTQVSDLQAISSDPEDVGSLMRTQIGILSSPSLALGVVKALNLTKIAEFSPRAGGVGAAAKKWLVDHGLLPTLLTTKVSSQDKANVAAAILSSKISFSNDAQSRLLGIAVTTLNPVLSATIANQVAKQFLDFKVEEKFAAIQRAHDWLQVQVASLGSQVRADDQAVEAYRLSHGLGEETPDSVTNGEGQSRFQTVNRQQLDDISHQLIDVSRDLAAKESDLIQARAALNGAIPTSELPSVLASPIIAGLVGETAALASREADLAVSEGPGNPQLRSARARLAAMTARTHQEMASIASSLAVQVSAARAQQQALQQRMEELRQAVSSENAAELGLNTLKTQARATRNIYESFLSRAAQLANVAGIQEPDASLVSSAEPPLSPSAPQTTRLLIIAGFLSFVIGVVAAIILERLRGGISLPEQIENVVGLPLIGLIPRVKRTRFRRNRRGRIEIAMRASLDRLRGQFRVLGETGPKVLLVTSALPKEGKSVFSMELARNMAGAGWRVLLLECDLHCPSLAKHLGVSAGPGLYEILSGGSLGRTEGLIRKPAPNLDVILAGTVKGDAQELLASRRMSALLESVRARYDLVLLDTPPVLPVADALVLGRQADAALVVVQWEKTPRTALTNMIRLLRGSGTPIMGIVMTRVDLRTALMSGGRMTYSFSHYDGYHAADA